MRLKATEQLYVRSMGKALRVTSVFTGINADAMSNDYMSRHPEEACVAAFGAAESSWRLVLLANRYDGGIAIPREPVEPTEPTA